MIRHLLISMLVVYGLSSCNQFQVEVHENSIDSVKAKLSLLRSCGFFEKFASLDKNKLFDTLHKQRIADYTEMFGYFYDPGMELMDYQILYLDKERTVYGDAEAGVGNGNNSYVKLINAFADASDSVFNPQDVSETWEGEQGPIKVSFIQDEAKVEFQPQYYDDWLSEEVFETIQQQMKRKGNQQFYMFLDKNGYGLGQNFLYLRLSNEQRKCLEEKFGWKFSN